MECDDDAVWEPHLLRYLIAGDGREEVLRLLRLEDDAACHAFVFDAKKQCKKQCHLKGVTRMVAEIIVKPQETLRRCDRILVQANKKVYEDLGDPELRSLCKVKNKLRFRLSKLPNCSDFVLKTVPRNEDVGMLLSIRGTVIKTTLPKMLEFGKLFACAKCGFRFLVESDFEQFNRLDRPTVCPNPEGCTNSAFNVVGGDTNVDLCKDYQEVKIQEQVGNLNLGIIPRSIWVAVEDDLINSCKPGDDINVIGTVLRRWQPLGKSPGGRTDIELVVRANYIRVFNDRKSSHFISDEQIEEFRRFWTNHKNNPLLGRNKILSSFCPQVYGLYAIKMALAVVLCGGVERVDEGCTKVRGEPHMLMVGDPGTGKSQLLRYASKLSPRSILTTGIGSTSAGLTVSAVKDSGEWTLEAGALVLADGGICCIDEFNSIKESDRACIHEAMEQQSLSVAKAGLVCKLQTKCTVLAATNPKGQYDPTQPLTVNAAIASPLLSRFDLVFVLLDSINETWDRLVSSYVLYGYAAKDEAPSGFVPWTLERLQSYFSYCKRNDPELSDEASTILSTYYQRQRQVDSYNMARTTVRLLQSAIRLSQGHARLMSHDCVTTMDAVYAVLLLETSAESSNVGSSALHTTFPSDPVVEYREQAEKILTSLGLEHVWLAEKALLEEQWMPGDVVEASEDVEVHEDILQDEPSQMLTNVLSKIRASRFSYASLPACPIIRAKAPRKRKSKVEKTKSEKRSKKTLSSSEEEDNSIIESNGHNREDRQLDLDISDTHAGFGSGAACTSTQVLFTSPSGNDRAESYDKKTAVPEAEKASSGKEFCDAESHKVSTKTLEFLKSFAAPATQTGEAAATKGASGVVGNVNEKRDYESKKVKLLSQRTSIFEDPDNFDFEDL